MFNGFIILCFLILFNGILSASELAFLSLEKFEIDKMIRKRKKKAKKIKKVLENPNALLSTIQVGITLTGFFSSAFAASFFADKITSKGFLIYNEAFTNGILVFLITIILSFFTLVFGELVPKKIALSKPYAVACISTDLIILLQNIFFPLVRLLSISTDFICKIFNIKEKENDFTEEDIKRIILTGTRDGIIEKKEQEYIFNIFKFNYTSVDKVMKPLSDCEVININSNLCKIINTIRKTKYTRYPVYSIKQNNILWIPCIFCFSYCIYYFA